MKTPSFIPLFVASLAAWFAVSPMAQAQTNFIKADNANALNLSSSYTSATGTNIPSASDNIVFGSQSANRSINAGNVSINGLIFSNTLSRNISFTSTDITIGAGGINSSSTATTGAISFIGGSARSIILSANQTWSLGNTNQLVLNRLLNTGGNSLNITSSTTTASVSFQINSGGATWGDANTTISVNRVDVSSGANFALSGNNTYNALNITDGTLSGSTLGNSGVASAFGSGGSGGVITLGANTTSGALRYTGNSASSDRIFNRVAGTTAGITNGTIEVTQTGQTLTLQGALSTTGNATVASGWRLGGAGNLNIAGVINDATNATGTTFVTKNGAGILTLSGANTYEGATTVEEGTLVVNGSINSNSIVTVAAGATLGGSGTIGGATTVNGNLQPGNSPGVLTFASDLTLTATADTTMEINGLTRGTDYDGIDVGGLLTYDGDLILSLGQTFGVGTYSFNLFDSGSRTGEFDSIALTGSYTGNLTGPGDEWNLTIGDSTWTFKHSTGDLGLVVVPEPSTWALLAAGLTAVVVFRRRKAQ
jgi:autotransporter-associated beta strand protein